MASAVKVQEIDTPSGPARVHLSGGSAPRVSAMLVLGHGAGGGIDAPDLLAVTAALNERGWTVARVEQPYRVKGHRAPEAATRLDAAWIEVVAALRGRRESRVFVAGRSSGARVACRTSAAVGAEGVIALAFPLHPPGKPEKSRVEELIGVAVPVLVVQGSRDPFGNEAELRQAAGDQGASLRTIVSVAGDHSLRQSTEIVAETVVQWVAGIVG